jgi:3-hydroxymyristoyl/3-hydroxydecanoyl-(acyl carrier protein) dehydratase
MYIPASHPALPGHFPGQPVVPGVVLLEFVAAAVKRQHGERGRVTGFPAIKFLAPLGPDQDFDVLLTNKRPGLDSFEVRSGETRLVSGTVAYDAGAVV